MGIRGKDSTKYYLNNRMKEIESGDFNSSFIDSPDSKNCIFLKSSGAAVPSYFLPIFLCVFFVYTLTIFNQNVTGVGSAPQLVQEGCIGTMGLGTPPNVKAICQYTECTALNGLDCKFPFM